MLQTGPLAPTSEPYAMAQVASIVTCQVYARRYGLRCACVVASDLYGPGDDFDLETGRVLPALIRRLYEARESGAVRVVLPGPGTARLQYLYVDDLADACLFLMREREDPALINVGSGQGLTSHALAGMVAEIVGYPGGIGFDNAPGVDRSPILLDVSRIEALGWAPRTAFTAGIAATYRWYLESRALAVGPG
jgi:GDP-L-fucose synthase